MQITETINGYDITAGYDEPLGHVFLVIEKDEGIIFSNLLLDDPFKIKDFSYFTDVAKSYGLDLQHMEKKINAYKESKIVKYHYICKDKNDNLFMTSEKCIDYEDAKQYIGDNEVLYPFIEELYPKAQKDNMHDNKRIQK